MNKIPVYQYNQGTGDYEKRYESFSDASKYLKIDESSIRRAAKQGKGGYSNSYLWSIEKRDNFWENNIIKEYAISQGIDPATIIKSKIYETVGGLNRISIETKDNKKKEFEVETDMFQKKQKQLQRKTDESRVLNKHFREYARIENTLTALNESLIEQLNSDTYKPITYDHPKENKSPVLLIQVTDLHLNELVEMPDNQYGFVVGAKRMQKYAEKIRRFADIYKSSEIVVAITGDLLNSDRRLDEKMYMATNRMKASIIASQILYHFLQDINRAANLSILCVSGNESRVNEEFSMTELAMSDNYDFLIFNMLKLLFRDAKGVTFVEGDPVEQVININNSNILITHGTTIKEGQAAMQQVFGKYAGKGILLDYAIFGHVHFTNITDIYSRSGSLVGNNVYSDRMLNLITKASQVVHIINSDGNIDNIKVGLQFVDKVKGYDIKDDLRAYNSKMADNTKQRETIVKVII